MQIQLDFNRKENNPGSQAILNANKQHFNNQCQKVYDALERGERLTTTSALIKYGIGDLRRRVADLKEKGINIKSTLIHNRFKEYYL